MYWLALLVLEVTVLKFCIIKADRVFTMNTKLLFIGAVIFSFLSSKTEDLLFVFLAVYLSTLAISVFFFKREQKQHAKSEEENSPLPETTPPNK